jgi:hypothetical protein
MSDLTGQTVADTYKDVIQVGNAPVNAGTGANDAAIQYIQDGAGVDIPIAFRVNGNGAQNSQVKLGMAGTESVTLSSDSTEIEATHESGQMRLHASGSMANVTVSSQDIDIIGQGSTNLKYGDPTGVHAILKTAEDKSVLQWGPPVDTSSSTHVMQTIVTQSYVSHAAASTTMLNSNRVQNVNPNSNSGTSVLPALSAGAVICVINGDTTNNLTVNFQSAPVGSDLTPGTAAQYVSNDSTWIRIS